MACILTRMRANKACKENLRTCCVDSVQRRVNCMSVEKLRTLHIAWLHRKVMVEDFRTQYAFFNGHAIDCMLSGVLLSDCVLLVTA